MNMITIDRALVEQALEALERLQNAIYNIGGEHVTGLFVANAAADSAEKPMGTLRAALAQQDEPVAVHQFRSSPLPGCNRGNRCPWTDESKANGWRSTCRHCGLRAQGSGQ